MSVKPIIPSIDNNKPRNNNLAVKNDVAFQGANPMVAVMDAVDRYGFAGTFILQDFLGMAGPRTLAGITRNHDKTGEYNWDFARREGTREILSGPSAFLIPASMLPIIKRLFGSSNNVPIDFINGFGETLSKYDGSYTLSSANPHLRREMYNEMFKSILSSSTDGQLKGKELENAAFEFAHELEKIHDKTTYHNESLWNRLTGKADVNSRQYRLSLLTDKFVDIRKQYMGLDVDAHTVVYNTENGKASASLKSTFKYMKDYTNDAIKSLEKAVRKASKDSKALDVPEFFKSLSKRRSGSRFLSNMAMFSAVVAFYKVIPVLYNLGIKDNRDPGLDGLNVPKEQMKNPAFDKVDTFRGKSKKSKKADKADKAANQPAFTGGMGKVMEGFGETISKSGKFKSKFSDIFEFDGPSMGPMAMLTLLFGFCLPPRLKHAKSEYEHKEIWVRDITSFISILFLGKALARGFSKAVTRKTGIVLTKNPEKHDTFLRKFWNYVSAIGGIKVFDSPTIISKYSGLRNVKNGEGFTDFIKFIKNNGGNINKVMANIDENVAKAAEKILGKPIKEASYTDMLKAFKDAKTTHPEEMETIYKAFDSTDNKFVTKAKSYNSFFNLVSNLVIVPFFMIALAKYCENMTAKDVAQTDANSKDQDSHPVDYENVATSQPSMKGFLAKAGL